MSTALYSQDQRVIAVKGRIVDSKESKPLAGASIAQIKGSAKALANENGNFTINVSAGSKLIITVVGYKSQTITASEDEITVQMEAATSDLDEVVVVGYTSQRRELMTGSVAQVKLKQADIEVPTTTAGNLLAGRMSGVLVSTSNGLPGAQPGITIRTQTSSNAAPVLYVIDGKISGSGDFNNLSPNESRVTCL